MIRKVTESKRKGAYSSRATSGRISRTDDSHLLLPPNFDAKRDDSVFSFLDDMMQWLNQGSSSTNELIQWFRHLYAVLQLRRRNLDPKEWKSFQDQCRRHPLTKILHEDALTYRAYSKPRGYAGDAVLLDMMYGTEHCWDFPDMSEIGHKLHACTTMSSACMGVKTRRAIISEFIDGLAVRTNKPHVLSLACGHLREAEITASIIRRQMGRFIAVDNDEQSLEIVDREYGKYGVETVCSNARETLSGRISCSGFDLIYSSGLCDYLNEPMGQRLAGELFDRLNPGGQLLLTNFVDNIEGVGYMEAFMDWNLIYRDRIDMMIMMERIPDREVNQVTIFSEENDNVLFAMVERAS